MHTCKAMMNVGYKAGKAVAQGDINIATIYSNWAKDIIKEADNKEELIQRFRGEFSRGCHRHCKGAIMDSFEARIDRNLPPDSVLHNVYSRKIKQISSSHLSVLVENEDAPMGAEIFLWKDDQKTWYKSAGRQPFNREFPYGIPPGRREFVATGSWDYVAGTPGSKETAAEVANSGMEAGWVPGSGSNYDTPHFGMCVNDILNTLPPVFERGFFSSVKYANVNFEGGTPLNKGVEEYIVSSFINLFNAGRRIGISEPNKSLGNLKRDPTYWDLYNNLKPDDDDDEGSSGLDLSTMSMADFSNQKVQNVAEIPIRRDVVDNLLNRKNHNMSLLQFTQQILAPSAIGLNGNIQLGVRYTNGVIDIIPASISYKGITTDMLKSAVDSRGQNDEKPNHLLFDYKKRNSLIESVDMSSKMDPAAFLTYQNSSDLLKGRDYNVLKLLSYEGVAEDFKEFLDNTPKADDSGENYSGVITIDNNTGEVKVNKVRFEEVPSSVIDGIISANPERWARITAMMQGNNNFTTELLAFYMRGVTLIIHGTTHISPFNLINVTGVLPDLEGIYVVTNITEKVTPTSFQTILEGKLLRRKREGSGEFI